MRAVAASLVEPGGRYAGPFENFILALVVLSVASVVLEAIPALPGWATRGLRLAEIFVVVVFSLEYLLRLLVARHKIKFIFSFQGIVDLLSFAPFYLAAFDTRWLRILRMLRLLRVLKLQTHVLEETVSRRTKELAEKNDLLERAQAQLTAELDFARALQIAILPAAFPEAPGCDAAARMIPATTMGGDFYDFIPLADGRIGLVIADVSGKGVPAAFFMAVARTSLRDLAASYSSPGACLARVNEDLCAQNPLDLFVTVLYCILDPDTGMLSYANGGHNAPYLRHTDGSVEPLSGVGGLVIGAMRGIEYPDHVVQLRPGDRLVLYTDGVTEAFNMANEGYGEQRLIAQIRAQELGTPEALVEGICRGVEEFAAAAAQSDDITLVVLDWRRSASAMLA